MLNMFMNTSKSRMLFNQYKTRVPLKEKMAINVDPDQTPLTAASDQGLHCLH